jgi:ribosomal protein S18 acetylase RimI-like enzyme
MQFELTETLIDEILFSMEDQNGIFCMDTQEGIIISEDDEDFDSQSEDGRIIPLPGWDSSEGFILMERFASGFKNTIIRDRLTAALDRGHGVFRAFKDVLSGYPEAEHLWYAFKEKKMRQIIINWYNGLREEWGLERIGTEPEETGDLVQEDFRFRDASPEDRNTAEVLHRDCTKELHVSREHLAEGQMAPGHGFRDKTAWLFTEEGIGNWVFPGDMTIIAETGSGEFAAYITALIRRDALEITALEVRPEYRGLGVGEALLSRLLERANSRNLSRITLELPAGADAFSRVLLRNSFKPYTTGYVKYVRKAPGAGAE